MFASKKWINGQLDGFMESVRVLVRDWVKRDLRAIRLEEKLDAEQDARKAAGYTGRQDEAEKKAAAQAQADMDHAGCCADGGPLPIVMGIDMGSTSYSAHIPDTDKPKWECGCWGCHSYRTNPRSIFDSYASILWGKRKPEPDDGRTPDCDSKKLAKVEEQLKALLEFAGLTVMNKPAVPGKVVIEPSATAGEPVNIDPIKRTRAKPAKAASKRK